MCTGHLTPYTFLDLMFEHIGKIDSVKRTIKAVRDAIKFIYNHSTVLSKLQDISPDEIVHPGTTRFTINYIALRSLREKIATGRSITETFLNPRFCNRWTKCVPYSCICTPLFD